MEAGAENPTERGRNVAGNSKFRGRLDEVGNGNLGVPLLPTMPERSALASLRGEAREMREVELTALEH